MIKGMDRDDVLLQLCSQDPRSPFAKDARKVDAPCNCTRCRTGVHLLAVEILRVLEICRRQRITIKKMRAAESRRRSKKRGQR